MTGQANAVDDQAGQASLTSGTGDGDDASGALAPTRRTELASGGGRHGPPAADAGAETAPAGGRPAAIPQPIAETAGANAARPAGSPPPALPAAPAGPVHAVAATVQLATARGFSHARLALNPPELGGVEVLLRSSSAGIVATLTADTPEAARLLEAGAGDLRRQLEAQGVELQRLEVDVSDRNAAGEGAAAGAQAGDGGRDAAARRAAGDSGRGAGRDGSADDGVDPAASPHVTRIDLGNGFLIDVVA